MKKLGIWLAVLILALGSTGCGGEKSPGAAPSETVAREKASETTPTAVPAELAEAAEGQAFAAAMAGWLGGEETLNAPDRGLLCWDMAGWYAAREYRIHGHDLIPAAEIEDFLRSAGYDGPLVLPEGWTEYGAAARHTAPDGEVYYSFDQHCREIDAMLGVTTEVNTTKIDETTLESRVIAHYENGRSECRRFTVSFEPNPESGSAFPYRVTQITTPSGPELSGELSFSWDELIAANRLKNILSIYPALRHFNREYEPDAVTWVYPRGTGLTILTRSEGYASGYINGVYFTWQPHADGEAMASIESIDEKYTDPEARDDYLLGYLDDIAEMRFDGIEGDLIWTECTVHGGMRERVAVDRGTLALREVRIYYSDDFPPSTVVFLYDDTGPALEYLDSWDGPMRTVTLHWEDFSSGERVARDESVQIPADWEYLPWQARWGDYTAWMDEGYTKPYAYPGDGVDYTLYLSTAKG